MLATPRELGQPGKNLQMRRSTNRASRIRANTRGIIIVRPEREIMDLTKLRRAYRRWCRPIRAIYPERRARRLGRIGVPAGSLPDYSSTSSRLTSSHRDDGVVFAPARRTT